MKENLELQKSITRGVEKIVSDTLKATLKDPKESAFMLKFAAASKKAARIRMDLEANGEHAPGFLIASVTSRCNLHCAGCYSRCIQSTTDDAPAEQLSAQEWGDIFQESASLGISFILIAGGEPLLRKDILEKAAAIPEILFPVFTNGVCLDDAYFQMFDEHRNLVPVLSIEGGKEATDSRRGQGIYELLTANMQVLAKKHLLYGASITVTTENIREVTSPEYIADLVGKGCKLVLFIEFVPVTEDAMHLAPQDEERQYMKGAMETLREKFSDLLLLSFPGDELAMGGCMAAGREFFHINSHGGAEPCPFSPFSDINVRETSLRQALNSGLFTKIRAEGLLEGAHAGGCVLYEKAEQVKALLQSQRE